jgi:hypothetical protein
MIFSRYGLVLVHVPKTGGNSLQRSLSAASDDRLTTSAHQDGVDRFGVAGRSPHKHATLAEYAEVIDLAAYKVAITVRHPMSRAVSMFFSPHRWYRQANGTWTLERPVWNQDSFIECVSATQPATEFLRVNGKAREPDYVIRLEHLAADLAALTAAVGIPSDPLPHLNRSAGSPADRAMALLDAVAQDAVRKRFAADFDRFSYTV